MTENELSQKTNARITGIGWLIIIFTGIIAQFIIRNELIDFDNAATTATNIIDATGQFKLSIFLDLIMLTADMIVGVALYYLLKPVNKNLSFLSWLFRFAMAAIIAVNLLNLVIVLLLLSDASYLSAFDADQLESLVMFFLKLHSHGYDLSLVFFGLHLIILGYLIFKSEYMPRMLGLILAIASVGYLIDSLARLFLSGQQELLTLTSSALIGIAVVAELSISIWLIMRAGRMTEIGSA